MDIATWCEEKLKKTSAELLLQGFLAGAYIAFAGQVFTLVTASREIPFGLRQLFGGLVFSVGLIMVVLGKGELFTGNCLLVAHCLKKKAPLTHVLRNWGLAYGGNFLGAILVALLYVASGLPGTQEGIVATRIAALAQGKVAMSFSQGFLRGILCNWLVALAVLFAVHAENTLSRILVIPGPITTFVALGYEHSIANMYFLAAGIFQGGSGVTWGNALFQNLLPVTLGNIVGGSVFVGVLYSFLLREPAQRL